MSRLVIALGGNALGKTPEEQLQIVQDTASAIVDLVEEGHDVVLGHGNGTQVGQINLAMEFTHNRGGGTPAMPFPECDAMTLCYIGYHLQQAIQNELRRRKMAVPCASIVTQVVVDPADPAFRRPTKPVGMAYTKEEAVTLARERGYRMVEDSGRGYRRVVPSPMPLKIVELPVIEELVKTHAVIITVGGGGIPVTEDENGYHGIAAVIDKDRASARLALDLKADLLVILTAVEKVSVNFRKPDQKDLDTLSIEEAKRYIEEGQFAPGSMLPKIEACVSFVQNSEHGRALITSLAKAREALQGKTGTMITK